MFICNRPELRIWKTECGHAECSSAERADRQPNGPAPTSPFWVGYLFYLFIIFFFTSSSGMRFVFLFMPGARSKFYFNFILFYFFIFAALPQISLRPRDDPITVIAGENAQIDCMVADARPAPAITWVLGTQKNHFLSFLLFCFIPFPFRIPGIIICKKMTHIILDCRSFYPPQKNNFSRQIAVDRT